MDTKFVALFARLLLGLIVFFQGSAKIFKWGFDTVYKSFEAYEETILPTFAIKFAAYFTTYGEFTFGLLLLLGLFRKYAWYGIGLILLIVSFGYGLKSGVWDTQHVLVRAVFLIFIGMTFDKDTISLDYLLQLKRKK